MSYQIPADIRQRLQAHIAAGVYSSEEEVLREALDALDRVEQDKLTHWEERNRLSEEQSRQGLSQPLDDKNVLRRLRERLAAEGIL